MGAAVDIAEDFVLLSNDEDWPIAGLLGRWKSAGLAIGQFIQGAEFDMMLVRHGRE